MPLKGTEEAGQGSWYRHLRLTLYRSQARKGINKHTGVIVCCLFESHCLCFRHMNHSEEQLYYLSQISFLLHRVPHLILLYVLFAYAVRLSLKAEWFFSGACLPLDCSLSSCPHTTVNNILRELFPFSCLLHSENPPWQNFSPSFPQTTKYFPCMASPPPSFPPPSCVWDKDQQQPEPGFKSPGDILANISSVNINSINIALLMCYMNFLDRNSLDLMHTHKIWESTSTSNCESSSATYNLRMTIIWKLTCCKTRNTESSFQVNLEPVLNTIPIHFTLHNRAILWESKRQLQKTKRKGRSEHLKQLRIQANCCTSHFAVHTCTIFGFCSWTGFPQ